MCINRAHFRITLMNTLHLGPWLRGLDFFFFQSNIFLETNFSYPSPLSAAEQLSVQQPPNHPAGNLDVDAEQAEAIVVVFQLIPNPLVQRLFWDCPLLHWGNRADRAGGRSGVGDGRRLRRRRSDHRVRFHLCGRCCWRDLCILGFLLLQPSSWVMHAAGEEGGVVASVRVDIAIAGVPDWKCDGDVAGRWGVEQSFGGQRAAAVSLGQQIGSPGNRDHNQVVSTHSWVSLFQSIKVMRAAEV